MTGAGTAAEWTPNGRPVGGLRMTSVDERYQAVAFRERDGAGVMASTVIKHLLPFVRPRARPAMA